MCFSITKFSENHRKLTGLLCLFFVSIFPFSLKAEINASAMAGVGLGAYQVGMGMSDMGDSIAKCTNQQADQAETRVWKKCASLAGNILSTLGGLASMLSSLGSQGATAPQNSADALEGLEGLGDLGKGLGAGGALPDGSSALGGVPNSEIPSIADTLGNLCSDAGSSLCSLDCQGDKCSPVFKALDTEEIVSGIAQNLSTGNIDTGALSKTEFIEEVASALEAYNESDSLAELNNLGQENPLNSGGGGGRAFASLSDFAEDASTAQTSHSSKDKGLSSSSKGKQDSKGLGSFSLGSGIDLKALLNKRKKQRGKVETVVARQGDLYSKKSGKKLSIFGRLKRLVRGPENKRDLLLARMELMRQEAYFIAREKEKAQKKKEAPVAQNDTGTLLK